MARSLHAQLDSMTALSMSDDSEGDDDENDEDNDTEFASNEANTVVSPGNAAEDALGDVAMSGSGKSRSKQHKKAKGKNNKQQPVRWKKKPKVKYQPWAKNLLTQGETLDLAASLPHGLESEFCLKVYPHGKRCLCATGSSSAGGNNTILYSRLSGRTLARRRTALPPDCILDCVYDEELSVLWVLDIVKWSAQGWLVECDTDLRNFFLASRLSELGPQPFYSMNSSSHAGGTPLVVVPCPVLDSPLSSTVLSTFLTSLTNPATPTLSVNVTISTHVDAQTGAPVSQVVSLQLRQTGLLLYHRQSQYESGLTALVGWIPMSVTDGKEGTEGVSRFKQLVEEWQARGGEAAGAMES
ncbi:hypothetical protein ACM66B_004305 [Microbotryomycetes sp. NB124-2]